MAQTCVLCHSWYCIAYNWHLLTTKQAFVHSGVAPSACLSMPHPLACLWRCRKGNVASVPECSSWRGVTQVQLSIQRSRLQYVLKII